jgi:iron complex transport system permease protein
VSRALRATSAGASAALRLRHVAAAVAFAVVAALIGLSVGPAHITITAILSDVAWRLGIGGHSMGQVNDFIVWSYRAPRVVLGLLVGGTLAVAGGAYQGVFRNPLADPYLLGIAAGAGLGATVAIVVIGGGADAPGITPVFAFAGALIAVVLTWLVAGRGATGPTTLILAGIAVASMFAAVQTLLQQSSALAVTHVYYWLLGSLAGATWGGILGVLPYMAVSVTICIACARLLDVLSVGELESASLGLPVVAVRTIVIAAASLGAAAAVSAAGLIGFVGIVVPHAVRLVAGVSYRRILVLSLFGGAGFLVLADVIARIVVPGAVLPIGVVTAILGVPFFVLVLHVRRLRLR